MAGKSKNNRKITGVLFGTSTENCIDYYGENATNITNPNATSPVIEFWE